MIVALFFLQFIWAGSYIAMKLALAEMPLEMILVFRYGFAVLFLLLLGKFSLRENFSRREWGIIVLVGLLNFSASPYFQVKALTMTYATDVSIMVAFEPLISVVIAVIILKEHIRRSTLFTFLIATSGVIIMSWSSKGGTIEWARLFGDGLFFISLIFEGICSVTSRRLSQKRDPIKLLAWMLLAGFIGNLAANFEVLTLQNLEVISFSGWSLLIYLSLFCSVIGYGGWFWILKRLPINQAALSLFLQPIQGSLLAMLILGETVNIQTAIGGLVILSSLFIWLYQRLYSSKPKTLATSN